MGQATSQPQFAEVRGVIDMSWPLRMSTQLAVDPVCGHDAPPRAKMVASGFTDSLVSW